MHPHCTAQHSTHTNSLSFSHTCIKHMALMWQCERNLVRYSLFVVAKPNWFIVFVSIHGLLNISGLYQFIDVIECGKHGWLFVIGETGAFFIYIMTILSVLSISGATHIFEESQYFNIIGCRFSQLVQFSVEKSPKKNQNKTKHYINGVEEGETYTNYSESEILRILFSRKKSFPQHKWIVISLQEENKMCIKAKILFHASIPANFTVNNNSTIKFG